MNRFVLSLIFCFLCFCGDNCYAKDVFSFSAGLRLNVGEHREEVFVKKRLLSVLYWPLLPTASFNIDLDFYAPYFHFANEADIGFPSFAGNMKDEDYTDEKQQRITLFSQHITDIKNYFSIRSSIGVPIQCLSSLTKKEFSLTLEPSIGVYFSYIKWHAGKGYLQYKEKLGKPDSGDDASGESHFWKPSWPKIAYNGEGITYIKKTIFPFLQFDVKLHFQKKWILLFGVMFSPLLFAYSKDIHFDRQTSYLDNFAPPSFAFEAKTHVEWKIIKYCSLFGTLSYSLNYSKNGETHVLSLIDGKKIAVFGRGDAGILSNVAMFTLGSKFYF